MGEKMVLDNMRVKNNPAGFLQPIELEITFTSVSSIAHALQWKVMYVGSAKNQQFDQILEEFEISPIEEESTMKFTVDCPPPDYTKIPPDQLICVTALIITVSYRSQEFIRVGYYVHNALAPDATHLNRDNASIHKLISHTKRTILFDKPRITKFKIDWTSKLDTHPSQSSHSHPQHINNQHIKNQDSNQNSLENQENIAEKHSTLEERPNETADKSIFSKFNEEEEGQAMMSNNSSFNGNYSE